MALSDVNNGTGTTMLVQPAYCNGGYGNYGGGLFGNGGDIWGIIFLAAILGGGFGFGGYGYGGFSGGAQGVADGYILASDMAQLNKAVTDSYQMTERKLDGINNGICSLGYDQLAQMNGINQNIANTGYNVMNAINTNGYNTINAIQTNGYESRFATQALGNQLGTCCCEIKEGIAGINYNSAMQTNAIQQAIANGFCQTNYNAATNHAQTLQAIDKLGDRFFSYMANRDNQALRDENFALKLAASQERQNNYLVETLGQGCPKTVYVANPPQAVNFPTNYCNNGCNC
jgi:hypothetical protein